jgi:hypothetical protein
MKHFGKPQNWFFTKIDAEIKNLDLLEICNAKES